MDLNLTNKTALVCGASQGIGKACAQQLAKLGANIVLFARNQQALEQVKAELDTAQGQQHQVLVADFFNPMQVKLQVEKLVQSTGIDILINNTGGPAPGPAHTADTEDFTKAFALHLVNNQQLVQSVLPHMQKQQWGRIINVISTSVKQPIPGLGVSNTIRGAVASWSKTLASELGPDNITVNNVLPGATATARLDAIIQGKANKQGISVEQAAENEKAQIPLRRFAEPEEFANAVAFLASPAANYITGINLPVDGGRTACL